MGLLHNPTSKRTTAQRLRTLTQTPRPQTKRELLSLLGLLNFFQIWVQNFSLHAKPLYQATQGNLDEPYWPPPLSTPQYKLLSSICYRALLFTCLITPSLFSFFVHSQWGHALGVLCQKRGDIWGPLAYLSKQLYLIMLRWPPSLQALASTTS